jgi:hypothetical protein
VHLIAQASALHLYDSFHGGEHEIVDLEDALLYPTRADVWAIDSGETYECSFSDSDFAVDRCLGYVLCGWGQSYGPKHGPFDELRARDREDDDHEAFVRAEAAYDVLTASVVGETKG